MYKIKDGVDNDNEDIKKNLAFGNEAEWSIVLV
jgi:hypothetical protein